MFSSKDLCKQQMNSHLYPILKRSWQITLVKTIMYEIWVQHLVILASSF